MSLKRLLIDFLNLAGRLQMDDFKVIYRILKTIYDAMDYDEFDFNTISPEAL